jgi:hypothetical protein
MKIKMHTAIICLCLCGCKTWYLTLREEHRLRTIDNSVLTKIFGLKREEVIGDLRKLHKEEHHDSYSLSNIIWVIKQRRMTSTGQVARKGEIRNPCRTCVGKPEEKYYLEGLSVRGG